MQNNVGNYKELFRIEYEVKIERDLLFHSKCEHKINNGQYIEGEIV